jgi:hypothetical protein
VASLGVEDVIAGSTGHCRAPEVRRGSDS